MSVIEFRQRETMTIVSVCHADHIVPVRVCCNSNPFWQFQVKLETENVSVV